MLRFLFGFISTVLIARWIYSEVQVTLPQVIPLIDSALLKLEIPTHNRWDREKINKYMDMVSVLIHKESPSAQQSAEPKNLKGATVERSSYSYAAKKVVFRDTSNRY